MQPLISTVQGRRSKQWYRRFPPRAVLRLVQHENRKDRDDFRASCYSSRSLQYIVHLAMSYFGIVGGNANISRTTNH